MEILRAHIHIFSCKLTSDTRSRHINGSCLSHGGNEMVFADRAQVLPIILLCPIESQDI